MASVGGFHQVGVHWLPAGLRSPGYPPRSPPAKMLLLRDYLCFRGWIPTGVDSQKKRSAASDAPGCAPQHRFSPGKEPENNGLAVWLSPVRLPVDPKKPSPPSHPVNRLPPAARLSNRLDPDLDSGSDSGVHHAIHPETVCAGDLLHALLPSILNLYTREPASVPSKSVRRTLSYPARSPTPHPPA